MYEGLLKKDVSGSWYTDGGEIITDLAALLDALPPGTELQLQAPDDEVAGAEEDDPTALEKARQAKAQWDETYLAATREERTKMRKALQEARRRLGLPRAT